MGGGGGRENRTGLVYCADIRVQMCKLQQEPKALCKVCCCNIHGSVWIIAFRLCSLCVFVGFYLGCSLCRWTCVAKYIRWGRQSATLTLHITWRPCKLSDGITEQDRQSKLQVRRQVDQHTCLGAKEQHIQLAKLLYIEMSLKVLLRASR